MHFSHLQWSLQLYLKFARQCMKCYCCCSPPGNRPYSMWCWYQFSVSSVVWKTTAMKIIAGPLTSEFMHLSGIIVKHHCIATLDPWLEGECNSWILPPTVHSHVTKKLSKDLFDSITWRCPDPVAQIIIRCYFAYLSCAAIFYLRRLSKQVILFWSF